LKTYLKESYERFQSLHFYIDNEQHIIARDRDTMQQLYDINRILHEIYIGKAAQREASISTSYTIHWQFIHKQRTGRKPVGYAYL
jgi:hypothetical protein